MAARKHPLPKSNLEITKIELLRYLATESWNNVYRLNPEDWQDYIDTHNFLRLEAAIGKNFHSFYVSQAVAKAFIKEGFTVEQKPNGYYRIEWPFVEEIPCQLPLIQKK